MDKWKVDSFLPAAGRTDWIDRIRVLLTILVIAVHAGITYGSEGGWYYQQPTDSLMVVVPLTLISAVSQSFFMSLFFFVSGYFIPGSYEKKGLWRFTAGRLIRLGIPCLLFMFGVGPLTIYLADTRLEGLGFRYWDSIHIGPLWFARALLIFTAGFVAYRLILRKKQTVPTATGRLHSGFFFGIFGTMAILTFLARWVWPMGEGIWGMQLGSFPQYIMSFSLGIAAQNRGWLNRINRVPLKRLGLITLAGILLLPVVLFLGADPENGFEFFMGQFHWQAVFYAVWESGMCVVLCLLILGFFGMKQKPHSPLSAAMASSAFTVYIVHSAILIAITVLMLNLDINPLLKFVILLATGTIVSFFLAEGIRRVPVLRKIL
jgi:glucan biosynthesis protein C